MSRLDTYEAFVKIVVELRNGSGTVASYSVTRKASGPSAVGAQTGPADNLPAVLDTALVDALAAHRAMAAGVQNTERRRLK